MPRVLLTGFCGVPGPRRAGVQLRHIIRSLTPLHAVDVLVVREDEQPYVERQGGVRVLRVPTHEAEPRAQIQSFQRALKRQLDGADYDVVHCRDSWAGIPVLEARSRFGYAVVYDLTRSPLGEPASDGELDAQYARDEDACLLAADMVLAPTPAAVKALQNRGKPERVVLAPPGVDVDRFDWEEVGASATPRILYVGSIDPWRGVRVLVRAMAAIAREVDARLVLAGPMAPKFGDVLRDGIRELNLTDRIEVLGPVDHDQLPTLIATATVCVVPAASDLTPNPLALYPTKLLEYMACRRPVVAPRRETIAQVVENNREALLFEPGDPVDLARKVLRLLGEPLLRDRLAQNAYERVRRDFTASAARRAIRGAYAVLAERFEIAAEAGDDDDDAPKIELLADDDFEATVFEEAPAPPRPDAGLESLDELLVLEIDGTDGTDGTGSTSSQRVIAPPAPHEPDETVERPPVFPADRALTRLHVRPDARETHDVRDTDDWGVTTVAAAVRPALDDSDHANGDDGTPIEGVAAAPSVPIASSFIAGEIDVPTPPPEREHDTPAVEFTISNDPDTGSRTPPIERR